jgi:hypothetical protein
MATVTLSAVGSVVGGPLGAAIGAIIGQQIDNVIFAPKGRQGPRLGELAVQTSSYGAAIPKIFGTMRVAGTVIWATDLREDKSSTGGGKGKPKTTNYNYSASFAVALSGRPVQSIGRIWADGKLLRGIGGDFKSRTKYRFYTGSENQTTDPLIASAEGAGQTPAFRGIAYAMFEDFQLADYGNRIPSLTFEVVAEDAPITIGAIAGDLSGGVLTAGETISLAGYAASGDSVRGAIEILADATPLSLVENAGVLTITSAASAPLFIAKAEAGARAGDSGGKTEIRRRAAGGVADEVSIVYYDIARDYQSGLQRAVRNGYGQRSDRLALPAALSAASAKAIAESRMAALWAGRATAKLYLPLQLSEIRPGSYVRMEGQPGLWKVHQWSLGPSGVVTLELASMPGGALVPAEADAGRPIGHPDFPAGPTTVYLFDLPLYEDQIFNLPRLVAMAAGAEAGWRQADLMVSYDNGASWSAAGVTAGAAVIGQAATMLGSAGSALLDDKNSVEIELLNEDMWLEGRTDAALINGANLAVLGDELIQFGAAEALGGGRFRLSRLFRGRRGTEWATQTHSIGEAFALIEPEAMSFIEPPAALAGGEARLLATGLDDEAGVETSQTISGEISRPPSPVHLAAERQLNGDIAISWVRRSRNGWSWLSGSDTPLGEENEAYQVRLAGAGFARTATVTEPSFIYSAADQSADGLAGPLTIEICQLGTAASSRVAQLNFGV